MEHIVNVDDLGVLFQETTMWTYMIFQDHYPNFNGKTARL